MIVLKKIIILTAFLMLLLLTGIVSAYDFLSVYQDDGLSDHIVEAPSFYWPGECEVDTNLLVTASSGASYSLSNKWFSPNQTLIATSIPIYSTNINCLSQGIANADTDRNNFYESRTETISTAATTDTWVRTTYDCIPDSDNIITYSNTNVLDAFDAFPYGYVKWTGGYCEVGSPGTLPSIDTQLGNIITNIQDAYDTECSSTDLQKAEIGEAPSSCALNRFFGTTFWYYVPFNSGSSGIVNISLLEQEELQTGICGSMTCITNKTYRYNTFLDTNTSIGTSLPLNKDLVLQRDTDYWLLIGTECTGTTGGSGSCTIGFNHTDYDMDILDCEPEFECGEWTNCSGNIQTRTCEDVSECNVPALIEPRSCFDIPVFNLTLGFEDTITTLNGVYICQKQFWLIACLLDLQTIDALYPANWTVFPDFDGSGVARDNFIKMSSETASVGSKSLKMWYIPPKLEEPVSDGGSGTVCGNASSGSFPEANHPYNESLFISQNITFANPFPQIRYDVRKCNEPVLQYDLAQFGCGKLCYASSCNETPRGRYGLRITRNAGQLTSLFPPFSMFNSTVDNVTSIVTDGNTSTYAISTFESGFIVNSTSNIFVNGTRINFVFNLSNGIPKNLCVYENDINQIGIGTISVADTPITYNITLENLTSEINEINISSCGGADDPVSMFTFNVENFINLTTSRIVFDYIGFAPNTWDAGQITHDLSNVDLDIGANYTISLSINPENQFDPFTHCAYIDNFRVTFTEIALPECVSECIPGSIDRRIASLSNGVCTFITQTNSPDCMGDAAERKRVNDIILGLGGGDVTDNSTCIDSDNDGISDDLYIFDTQIGKSEIILDSAACLLLINETLEEAKITQPLESAEEWVDWIFFLVSPIFIYFYISLAISGAVGALVNAWQSFGITFATCLFIGMLISVPGGTAPIIPIWVGVAMIAVISLLMAKTLTSFAFPSGGG